MNPGEQRCWPRHRTELRVTINKDQEKDLGTMIDISRRGIGLVTQRGFFTGTKLDVTIHHIDDFSIPGTVKWASQLRDNDKIYYRIGVEAERVLVMGDIIGG